MRIFLIKNKIYWLEHVAKRIVTEETQTTKDNHEKQITQVGEV
jgi:hypothetical protein